MSKHWDPKDTGWLSNAEFRALSPGERRALYSARGQERRARNAHHSWQRLVASPKGRTVAVPGTTIVVLVFAAVAGLGAGVIMSRHQTPPRVTPANPGAVQMAPAAKQTLASTEIPLGTDPSDIAWEQRGENGHESSSGAGSSAAAAIHASFTYCYSGGGTDCVVDGDTFYVRGAKVRIADIDAPETHPSRCAYEARLGNAATQRLHDLLNSGPVTMTGIDRDRDKYGRLLRNVQVNGEDVGDALASAGLAREWTGHREPWC
jgi:endonuclease YncB( thermonuclease family)